MARLGETAGALRRSERGYTLIELLVAAAIGMVVMGGAVTVFVGAVHSEPRTASQVSAVQQGRVAVERIVREVRQGVSVQTAEPGELALVTYVKQSSCGGKTAGSSIPCLVTYSCAEAACTRTVAEPDGGLPGSAVQLVSGLASTEVFEYFPAAPEEEEAEVPATTYVEVSLSFSTREGGPVVVADGAALRNEGGSE